MLSPEYNAELLITYVFPEYFLSVCWICPHFSGVKQQSFIDRNLLRRFSKLFVIYFPHPAHCVSTPPPVGEGLGERENIQHRHRIQHIADPAVLFRPESRKIELGVLREEDVREFVQPLLKGGGDIHGGQCSKTGLPAGATSVC